MRLSLISSLLILAACGDDLPIGTEPPSSSSSGDGPAPGWPCSCDANLDGVADPHTCAPGVSCGIVCPVGSTDCLAGIPSGVPLCFEPCVEDTEDCDCVPFSPASSVGFCFSPPACIGG